MPGVASELFWLRVHCYKAQRYGGYCCCFFQSSYSNLCGSDSDHECDVDVPMARYVYTSRGITAPGAAAIVGVIRRA